MPATPRTPFDDLDPAAVLRPADIAGRLGVDARSVRRAIGRGELVASRTCGIRVLAADAAAWWTARRVVVAPEAPPSVTPPIELAAVAPRRSRRRVPPGRLPLPARGDQAS